MGSLGGGNIWGMGPFNNPFYNNNNTSRKKRGGGGGESKHSDSVESIRHFHFPLKQAATAATLALTGDTIAQLRQRWLKHRPAFSDSTNTKEVLGTLLSEHDWLRAVRMTSYGFLFYGPGSYAWYQFLDRCMPMQNVQNVSMKVLLNQIILGPSVIAVIFAWNNLWQGKLGELPKKYQKDALPTLFFGFRFWIPVSILNFWVVPLQARVAFMSMNSIFWNFYLSSTMSQ